MNEILQKIIQDLEFAGDDLREALRLASAVESLLILPLIKQVNETRIEVNSFMSARIH